MPLEVELGIPLYNPLNHSEYSQSLRKSIQNANILARQQLEKARKKQSALYDKGHKSWTPLEPGQTVWLWRPKHWKFGRRWTGPYKIASRQGVNYNIQSNSGKLLVVHHNQLKPCPIPFDQGQPIHPVPETPGIQIGEALQRDEQEGGQGGQIEGTARPARLRQVINPPRRFGEFVVH